MKIHKKLICLAIALGVFAAQTALAQKNYKDLTYPPLHKITVPNVERVVLENGMVLYLVEDHELPLINLSARIGVGSMNEPADKIGLASLTGTVMRTGGTTTRSGDELDELLESIAASVETSIGLNSGSASMSVLKEDLDTGLAVLADLLMNPTFPEEKIELAKVNARSEIARRNDDANQIAFREFGKLIYGQQSVFARTEEYATIDAITRDDLVRFHKQYFHPNNVMLAVWGDFNTRDMTQKIKSAFKGWQKIDLQKPKAPPVEYTYGSSVNLVRKDDVNQSSILIGHIGGLLNNPDYYALTVMNEILSGGFASRLFSRVRSDQGLAYAVFGGYGANYDYPGQFYVGCMTKSGTTVQAIKSLLHEVKLMQAEEVTDEEMAKAKESYFNSYVFNFDSRSEVVNRLMTYEYYGYPKDFLEKTKENIEKVTKADVLRVARKYLRPEQVHILVVGNDKDFDAPLSEVGKVDTIDISIPVAEEKLSAASDESLRKGKTLLSSAISALGGAAAFQRIKNAEYTGKMTAVTPQGEMSMEATVAFMYPDRQRVDMNTPMGSMSQIMNGEQVWIVSPRGTMAAPGPMKESMREGLWHDFVFLFAHLDETVTVQYLGSEEIDGQKHEIIGITPQGRKPFKLLLNAQTMLPARMRYQSMSMQGPAEVEEIYTAFGEFEGLKIPVQAVVNQNGRKAQEMALTSAKFNTEIDENRFVVKQ